MMNYLEVVSCVTAPKSKTDAFKNQNIIYVGLDVDGIHYHKAQN